MTEQAVPQGDIVQSIGGVGIATIGFDQPWAWLSAGWKDLWNRPGLSLTYGLFFAVLAFVILFGLWWMDAQALILSVAAGFLLVGPIIAVGLYEKSRRLAEGGGFNTFDVIFTGIRSPGQLAFLGVLLAVTYLFWIRIATLLFALFFGSQPFPPLEEFVPVLLFSQHGLSLLIVGTIVGAFLALFVFSVSVVSVPLLMRAEIDIYTAVAASVAVVVRNPKAMLLWAAIIVVAMTVGMATLFVGLIVTFPLIGHATWHASRAALSVPD